MELLRIATAGSVDDGKSTLLGRLLYDTKNIHDDQLEAIASASTRRGLAKTDLSLLVDGLRAEREQGITIDVAYRYFATSRRAFIVADTPGHVQYTRNMVTGASTADVAIVLVDARAGIVSQTRKHIAIAALLRVPHVVIAVNKMDLMDFREDVYESIAQEFTTVAKTLGIATCSAVPVSALHGDNLVHPSSHLPWYAGPTLCEHLETLPVRAGDLMSARLAVQTVIRDQTGGRFYGGRLAGEKLSVGEEVVILPSGVRSAVRSLIRPAAVVTGSDVSVQTVHAGQSIGVQLSDAVDVSRGDVIASVSSPPTVRNEWDAQVCVVGSTSLEAGTSYRVRIGTREILAGVTQVQGMLDIDTGELTPTSTLVHNDLGVVSIRCAQKVSVESYKLSRQTGAFLLLDNSGETTAAGMII